MTTITIDRAVVEQALEALTAHADLHGTMYLRMDAITALRAALAQQRLTDVQQEMERSIESLKAALAQQAEPTPPDAAAGLVDDLCLLHMGWKSDAELDLHRAAMGRVIARAAEVRRLRLI